jgi:hypothetical protein
MEMNRADWFTQANEECHQALPFVAKLKIVSEIIAEITQYLPDIFHSFSIHEIANWLPIWLPSQ